MRVLHLFTRFRPNFAGDGLYFEKLWPALAALGGAHDVLVFTTPAPETIPGIAPPGMALVYLRRSEKESARAVLLRYYLCLLRNIRRYDAIHARTHIDRFFVSNFLARLFGVGFVYSATLDDSPPYILRTYRPSLWRFVKWAMRKTIARLVVLNRRLYDESTPYVEEGRVVIIPQGVALPAPENKSREDLRREFGLPRDATVQLYVGSVSRRKDVQFLVENLATVLAEAMAFALPIVARRLEGVTDFVLEDGKTGLLFDTAAEYRDCIRRLEIDRGLAARLGQAARAKTASDYSLASVAARYDALYREIAR
jgi:glycosyltransferase involved in cell wall biosynthesis